MKDIKKTLFMKEAALSKGHNIIIEICIAVLLFFIASIAMGIVQVPALAAYLISNEDYMSMIMSGRLDAEKMLSVMSSIPEWIVIVMLFAEILLTLIVLLYCRFVEKRKLSTLGFRKEGMARQYLLGLAAGAVAFSAAYILCVVTGSVKFEGIAVDIAPLYIVGYFFGYILQGMAEEVLCRGYLMVSLSRKYHVTFAITASSLFFAFLHAGNSGVSILAFINLFLFGVFASLLILDFENIWIAGAFHSIWNFVQGNVYGVQVSGMGNSNSILATTYTDGMGLINGGSFGMEGGLPVTFVLMAGIALLTLHLYKKGNIIDLSLQKDMAGQVTDGFTGQDSVVNEETIRGAGYNNMSGSSAASGSDNTADGNITRESGMAADNTITGDSGITDNNPVSYNPVNNNPGDNMENNKGSNLQETEPSQTIFDENYFKN